MRPWMDRALTRGRIHGRLLLVLVAAAAVVSAAAVWQFSADRGDQDPDLAADGSTVAAEETAEVHESTVATASSEPTTAIETSSAPPSEAPPTTAAATEAETTEAAPGPRCTASLVLDGEDDSSVSVTVEVANPGEERVDGWEVLLDLPGLAVTSTWGLSHIEGDRYDDVLFNAGLDSGDSVSPTFWADVEGEWSLPSTVPCTPDA